MESQLAAILENSHWIVGLFIAGVAYLSLHVFKDILTLGWNAWVKRSIANGDAGKWDRRGGSNGSDSTQHDYVKEFWKAAAENQLILKNLAVQNDKDHREFRESLSRVLQKP